MFHSQGQEAEDQSPAQGGEGARESGVFRRKTVGEAPLSSRHAEVEGTREVQEDYEEVGHSPVAVGEEGSRSRHQEEVGVFGDVEGQVEPEVPDHPSPEDKEDRRNYER
jgi:hypothetical protein